MSEKELRDGKIGFLTGLYQFKVLEETLIKCIKDLSVWIEEYHKIQVLENIPTKDLSKMITNKYMFLLNDLKKCNFDLMLFYDEESDSLYAPNFFSGMILKHFSIRLNRIHACLAELIDTCDELDKRLCIMEKRKLRILLSIIEGKKYYSFDKKAVECENKITEKYKELIDELNIYYNESIRDNYINLVEEKLKGSFENLPNNLEKFAEDLETIYEVDVDFLRFIGREEEIKRVRELYIKYMSSKGLDTSRIVESIETRHFISPKPEIFDPNQYLHSNAGELSRAVFELEAANIEQFFDMKNYDNLRSILKEVGIFLADPITINCSTPENTEPSNNENSGPKRK